MHARESLDSKLQTRCLPLRRNAKHATDCRLGANCAITRYTSNMSATQFRENTVCSGNACSPSIYLLMMEDYRRQVSSTSSRRRPCGPHKTVELKSGSPSAIKIKPPKQTKAKGFQRTGALEYPSHHFFIIISEGKGCGLKQGRLKLDVRSS